MDGGEHCPRAHASHMLGLTARELQAARGLFDELMVRG
jgi:hypothetical protein